MIGSLSPEQVKLRNSQYHFLAPRNVPTLHRHPVGIRPDPSSDFVPREKYAGQKETWAYDSSEVGAPARLAVWVDRARNGGLLPSQVAETQIPPRNAQEKNVDEWGGMGVGLGDPRIFENQFRMDKRISLLIQVIDGMESVGTKQTLILCDTTGRKVWKLSERIGFTGFNYDFYRYILADSNNKNTSNNNNTPNSNSTTTNTNKPTPKPITTKWYLIGTLDRTCPESSTGQANTIYGSLSNKCIANKQPPTMNLRHDNFCGRVGAGGVVGIASPTGCVGDSMIMPFTRLLMKWNGWGTHVVQAAVSDCNSQQKKQQQQHHLHQHHQHGQYSTQNPQSIASLNGSGDNADAAIVVGGEDYWETNRDGVSSAIMMGNKNTYRFLDQKTSRHAGTFVKIPERQESLVGGGSPLGGGDSGEGKHTLDRWELIIEPPVGSTRDKLKSNSSSTSTGNHLKCVRRSMPPEMMLAAAIVAQMMVDRKPAGRLNGIRGLVESEMGKGLGRKVKPILLPNLKAQ